MRGGGEEGRGRRGRGRGRRGRGRGRRGGGEGEAGKGKGEAGEVEGAEGIHFHANGLAGVEGWGRAQEGGTGQAHGLVMNGRDAWVQPGSWDANQEPGRAMPRGWAALLTSTHSHLH